MNIINKYNVQFVNLPLSLGMIINTKLTLVMSILNIEFVYYRSATAYIWFLTNITLISALLFAQGEDIKILVIASLITINAEFFYLFFNTRIPYIGLPPDRNGLYINLDEESNRFSLYYQNRCIGYIRKAILPALLFTPLLKECIENQNLPEHKIKFIARNLEIYFEE